MLNKTFSANALAGRKAIVFAASQGLGKASAEMLAAMGAQVVLLARSTEHLAQTAQAITVQTGQVVQTECVDLQDAAALQAVLSRHQDADILVSNCGGPPIAPFEKLPLSAWDSAYQMIVRSVVLACQSLVPAMAQRGWGRVVMITSSTVVDPLPNFALSNALRKALLGVAESLAQEYAASGVTANLVCPGLTRTARMESWVATMMERTGKDEASVLQAALAGVPAKRMAEPHELAAAVAFLCSEAASFVQAQALVVDGGGRVGH